MFSNYFRYRTTKTGKYVKELTSELPITENRIEKLLLVRFLLILLLRPMVEKFPILFGQNCNIKDYELKFSTQRKFDTSILNLNLYVRYKVVMTPKLRNN